MLKKITGVLLAFSFAGLTWAQQIDLNKASEVELDALKGVGPVLTKAVMDERQKAPFKNWEDATSRVKGLGPQKASSLSDQGVRVQGIAYNVKVADQKPGASKEVSTDKAAAKAAKPASAAADTSAKPKPAKN